MLYRLSSFVTLNDFWTTDHMRSSAIDRGQSSVCIPGGCHWDKKKRLKHKESLPKWYRGEKNRRYQITTAYTCKNVTLQWWNLWKKYCHLNNAPYSALLGSWFSGEYLARIGQEKRGSGLSWGMELLSHYRTAFTWCQQEITGPWVLNGF